MDNLDYENEHKASRKHVLELSWSGLLVWALNYGFSALRLQT